MRRLGRGGGGRGPNFNTTRRLERGGREEKINFVENRMPPLLYAITSLVDKCHCRAKRHKALDNQQNYTKKDSDPRLSSLNQRASHAWSLDLVSMP